MNICQHYVKQSYIIVGGFLRTGQTVCNNVNKVTGLVYLISHRFKKGEFS
jgi:hypothetical protein